MVTKPKSLQGGGDAMFPFENNWGREDVLWLGFVFALMPCAVCGHGEPQRRVKVPRTEQVGRFHLIGRRRDSVQLAHTYLCSDVRSPSVKKREWRWCGNTVTREGSKGCRTSRESRLPFWFQQRDSRPIRHWRKSIR
jgi:hypothetical protein